MPATLAVQTHVHTNTHTQKRQCCSGVICIHLRDESLILPVKTLAVIYGGSQRVCHSSLLPVGGTRGVTTGGMNFGKKDGVVYDKTKCKGVFEVYTGEANIWQFIIN